MILESLMVLAPLLLQSKKKAPKPCQHMVGGLDAVVRGITVAHCHALPDLRRHWRSSFVCCLGNRLWFALLLLKHLPCQPVFAGFDADWHIYRVFLHCRGAFAALDAPI
jgi:hypothetical protein